MSVSERWDDYDGGYSLLELKVLLLKNSNPKIIIGLYGKEPSFGIECFNRSATLKVFDYYYL